MSDPRSLQGLSGIPILTGPDNWSKWNRALRDLLDINRFGDLLSENANAVIQDPGETDREFAIRNREWTEKQRQAQAAIKSRVNLNARSIIDQLQPTTISLILIRLENQYQPRGMDRFRTLSREMHKLQLADHNGVMEFTEKIRRIRNDFIDISPSLDLPEPHWVNLFLDRLGPDYQTFETALLQNRTFLTTIPPGTPNTEHEDPHIITFDDVVQAAMAEEARLQAYKIDPPDPNRSFLAQSAKVTSEKTAEVPYCKRCDQLFHTEETCWILHPELKTKDQKPRRGWKRRGGGQGGNDRGRPRRNNTQDSGEKDIPQDITYSYMATTSTLLGDLQNQFAMDSACEKHSCCDRSFFVPSSMRPCKESISGVGAALASEIGTIRIPCQQGESPSTRVVLELTDVLYCPEIPANLISVSQLAAKGVTFSISADMMTIKLPNKPVTFHAPRHRGLYLLNQWDSDKKKKSHINQAFLSYAIRDPDLELWHRRMGHVGEATLRKLQACTTGMRPIPSEHVCHSCLQGRMRETPHNHPIKRGTYPMEFIHTDIAGPFPVTGPKGERYWALFLDDYTQWAEIIPISRKSELVDEFRAFLNRHERPERRCHRVRLDQAGENLSQNMIDECYDRGIVIEPTTTDQHQQNGPAESTNRVVMDRLHPTLVQTNINKKWWPEVLRTISYLRNRTPSTVTDITPYEAWYGDKPDIAHIRVLGSTSYALKPPSQRKKLKDDKPVTGKLIGFEGSRIYRLLTPDGKIIRSSNVRIIEDRPHDEPPTKRCKHDTGGKTSNDTNSRKTTIPTAWQLGLGTTLEPPFPRGDDDPAPAGRVGDIDPNILHVGDVGPAFSTGDHSPATMSEDSPNASTPIPRSNFYVEVPPIMPTPDPLPRKNHHGVTFTPVSDMTPLPSHLGDTDAESFHTPDAYVRDSSPDPLVDPIYDQIRPAVHFDPNITTHTLYQFLATAAKQAEPSEPQTLRDAQLDDHADQWHTAMREEYDSLIENKTWSLVNNTKIPAGKRALRGKWVFKIKRGAHGEIIRYKARWVVRGFEQKEGIDYHETYASVVKPMTYKALFAIAAALDLDLEQMDVKTAFLYGDIDEEIYVEQPTGLGLDTRICKLNKALYGLKQSPRIWFQTLATFLISLGFQPITADPGVFACNGTYIIVYVDDLLIIGPNHSEIKDIKASLSKRFHMSDLGPCSYYLGIQVIRDRATRTIRLSQKAYIEKILREFDMWECKPVTTPIDTHVKLTESDEDTPVDQKRTHFYARLVGSLMYAMLGTRPDIAYAVSLLSRYMANPGPAHITAAKRVLRYLRGTTDLSLTYEGTIKPLSGFSDADWAGCHDTRQSTSGYVFSLGSGAISWSSRRQQAVALSSTEAEYMAETQATKEAVWLQHILRCLDQDSKAATPIYRQSATILHCDNQGAIALAKNPQFHARSKHIDIQWHYVRQAVDQGVIDLCYISTADQVADIMTKALPSDRFAMLRSRMGIK
jgi:hypothetical protein